MPIVPGSRRVGVHLILVSSKAYLLNFILASRSDDHAVVKMNNAASEAALTEQLEPHAEVVRQCSLTFTQDDRINKQMTLVDQFRAHRLPCKLGPPIVMSASEDSFSLRIASGSNSRSILVLALETA